MPRWLRKQTDAAFIAAFIVLAWAGWISYVQLEPVTEIRRFPLHAPYIQIATSLGLLALGYVLSRKGFSAASRAEEAAHKQNSILESVVENMGEGVVVADAEGKYLITNHAARDALGLHGEQLPLEERPLAYGLYQLDGVTPFPPDRLPLARAVKGESSNYVEILVRNARHPNGIILSVTGRPLKDNEGKPQGGLVVMRDITFRIRAAEELARKEEYFRSLIESSQDVITTLDSSGKVLFESASLEKMVGYRPAELVGKVAFEYVHPDDLPRVLEIFGRVLATPGSTDSVEYRFRHKDGSWRVLESIGKNMLHDGAVGAVVVTSRDMTERRQLEQERQWANYLADAAILLARETQDYESSLQAIARMAVPQLADWCSVTVLREGDQEEQIAVAHVDPAKVEWVRTWQKTFPQAPGRDTATKRVMRTGKSELLPEITPAMIAAANLPPEQLDIVRNLDLRSAMTVPLVSEGKTFGVITFVGAESGRRYGPADLSRAEELAVKAGAAISNARAFAHAQREIDIQKRQKAEALRQSEELERSNRELLDFTAVVSHDLQEPLRKVQTFGSLVESRLAPGADAAGRDYLKRMQEAAARMQKLIQDLLAFSRVETKAQPFVPVDLAGVVGDVLGDLEARLQQTGGKVEVGPLPALEGDALQMRQLFQNLLGNALKFHRPGVPPVVRVSARPSGEFCEIIVQDNGIGFDEKYLDRIFKAFQRLHSREEFEGTGMGLAICQKIAERHGGSITARSKPGEGSAFAVQLPVKQHGGQS